MDGNQEYKGIHSNIGNERRREETAMVWRAGSLARSLRAKQDESLSRGKEARAERRRGGEGKDEFSR